MNSTSSSLAFNLLPLEHDIINNYDNVINAVAEQEPFPPLFNNYFPSTMILLWRPYEGDSYE